MKNTTVLALIQAILKLTVHHYASQLSMPRDQNGAFEQQKIPV